LEIDGPRGRVKDLPDKLTATCARGPLGSAFDRVQIINLRRRSDRRAETLRELVALGESVDGHRLGFYEAVEPGDAGGFPSPGVRGCYLSHLAVLEAAAGDDVSMLLVMEDDVAFVRDADDLLVDATRQLAQTDWDIAYFGHALDRVPGPPRWLPVTGPMRYAHCYAVHRRVLRRLVEFLQQVLAREPGHPDGGPMHVDGAFSTFVARHADIRAVYFSRSLVYQRPSRTDLHRPSLIDRHPLLRQLAVPLRRLKRLYLKWVR
jgi:hypothetical protein